MGGEGGGGKLNEVKGSLDTYVQCTLYLELRVLARVEPVHPTKALARRPTTEKFNITFLGENLSSGVGGGTLQRREEGRGRRGEEGRGREEWRGGRGERERESTKRKDITLSHK